MWKVPVEVGAGRAAQLLIAKSHRVASEDELNIQRESEVAARKERQRNARRREGVVVVGPKNGDSQPIS